MEAILKREIVRGKTAATMIGVGLFTVVTTLGAFVRIPLPWTPVPITLQTMCVLLAGAYLGKKAGSLSQLTYIILGAAGLPVFTGAGSGFLYLAGPTGGYVAGFLLCAFFVGRGIHAAKSLAQVWLLFLFGDALIFGCGVLWLTLLTGLPIASVLTIGVLPFVVGDLIKISAAAVIFNATRRWGTFS
jgi:biotin transport system substrate-specific component